MDRSILFCSHPILFIVMKNRDRYAFLRTPLRPSAPPYLFVPFQSKEKKVPMPLRFVFALSLCYRLTFLRVRKTRVSFLSISRSRFHLAYRNPTCGYQFFFLGTPIKKKFFFLERMRLVIVAHSSVVTRVRATLMTTSSFIYYLLHPGNNCSAQSE